MRLQRALARAGVASRRAADALVAEGRVTVNGEPADIGQVVNPARDVIAVDGRPVDAVAPREWLVLHKPAGVLTTRADPEGRPTVFELVPDRPGLTYVGRLDYMTEGVLLFTTDGDAAHRLTHPSRAIERTYTAVVRGNAPAAVRTLRHGLVLEDGAVEASAVDARPLGNRRWEFELTIAEGRNREVRRICEALELVVERLVRVRFGPVRLGVLPVGESRPLNVSERRVIDALTQGSSPLLGAAGDELRSVGRDTRPRRRTAVGDSHDRFANTGDHRDAAPPKRRSTGGAGAGRGGPERASSFERRPTRGDAAPGGRTDRFERAEPGRGTSRPGAPQRGGARPGTGRPGNSRSTSEGPGAGRPATSRGGAAERGGAWPAERGASRPGGPRTGGPARKGGAGPRREPPSAGRVPGGGRGR